MQLKRLASIEYRSYMQELTDADSPEQLRAARINYQQKLLELFEELDITEWTMLVNDMHDLIGLRATQMCEEQMMEEGYGNPPVSYAFVVFGSCGRREATLWSDQDNGMIISNVPSERKEQYFQLFGSKLVDLLAYLGYEKCKGKVMCSEPLWCKDLQAWEEQLSEWRTELNWEPIRNLIIASDLRHIAGDAELSEAWEKAFHKGLTEKSELTLAILRNTVKHKATLNILGQVVTERFGEHAGEFDIKYGVYIPLVNFVRFLSLQQGVQETSTLKRLEKLQVLEQNNVLLDNCHRIFKRALRLRMSTPFEEQDGLLTSSGYLPEEELKKKMVLYELRESLGIIRQTHRALQRQLRFAERR